MKVLWFSVTPLSLDAGENTGVEGKGWIGALLQTALGIEGIEITVAYANISPERKETEERAGLRIVPINVSRYSKREIIKDMMTYREVDGYVIKEAQRIIDEMRPDLIHVFGTEWCFGLLAKHANTLNIPVVIHIQGLWSQIRNCLLLPGQSAFFDRLKPELLTHPLGLFARYHYYNLSMERHRREEEILRCNRMFMCRTRWDQSVVRFYNPEARIFHVDEALRQEFMEAPPQSWGQAPEAEPSEPVPMTGKRKISVVTVGACYAVKGPDVVLKTARLIRENTDYDVEWKWIGGTEDEMKEFEKLTQVKAKDVGVRMMGSMGAQEMIGELLKADMYVHTSYADNSPNAVCEAQYLGLPVIATDTGGVVSLFSERYDRSMLVPMNDPFYLASKMVELREDAGKAEKLSRLNRETAHERHDRERIRKQLEDTYRQMICGR